jgi:hypothetical protein
MNTDDYIGTVIALAGLVLSFVMLLIIKCLEIRKDKERVKRMLDFTESGRTSQSRSRVDS